MDTVANIGVTNISVIAGISWTERVTLSITANLNASSLIDTQSILGVVIARPYGPHLGEPPRGSYLFSVASPPLASPLAHRHRFSSAPPSRCPGSSIGRYLP